ELTAGKFLPDPWSATPGARLYRTGDRARYRPDGNLEFLGRRDHQVKIRGFRIELGEIEAALATLPGVREAVVVVREDTPGDRRLVAYVTGDPLVDDLRPWLRERLPEPMMPSAFVSLPALPLTPNGKVDRKALPAPDRQRAEEAYVPPRTPIEEIVAGIWAEVLGLERVRAADHFFELGGHSLLATRVVSRLREAFGVELPLRDVFELPNLQDLAGRVETVRGGGRAAPLPALVPVPREGDPPLSFAQERLWFLDQLEPGSPAYDIPGAVELTGRLDLAALSAALDCLVARHEILRTVFRVIDGQPRQHVLPSLEIGLPVLDLAGLPPDRRQAEAERLAAEQALVRFDLGRGPLLESLLLRLDGTGDRHRLLVVVHHVICDGWSLPLLVREVGELYAACVAGRPSPLAELPVQYADFAIWQHAVVAASEQTELAWWLERLGGEIAPLELPTDRLRPPVQTYRGRQSTRVLPPALAARLTAFGRAHGATPFMTLLAAIQALLHRHSGQDDILVGAPVAGRRAVETEPLIGCFLNTLVLRTGLGGEPGFRDLVARVREVTLGAFSHQDVPFEAILARLPQPRDLSRTPLFQVMVNLLNLPSTEMRLPGLALAGSTTVTPLSKLDMTFYVTEGSGGARIELVYNADLFDAARMEDLLAQLEALLGRALEWPETPVGGLSLVTAAARAVLPDPAAALSAAWEGAVHEILARHARQAPGALAVADPAESWTYGELEERSSRLAALLRAGGVGPGDVVALWAHRSAPLVWGLLGVLKAGAAFLVLDPRHPAPRQVQMLSLARPAAWLQAAAAGPVPAEIAGELDAVGCACRLPLPARAEESSGFLARVPAVAPDVEVGPDDAAYVAFTSGSTGVPKGVVGRHGSLSHFIPWLSRRFELSAGDRFSLLSGLAHDPLHRDVFTPLQIGAAVVIPDPETMEEPGELAAWMRREKVTVAHLTPALGQMLTTEATDGSGIEVPSLRYAFLVGDVLTRRDVARLRRLAPAVTCVNYYGSTETQRAVGCHVAEEGPDGARVKEVLPLGRGIPDVQLLVLNRAGALAGIGELGEISMRSPHIALAYLGDPRLTAQRFAPNPLGGREDGRLYRTGDLGRYLPNGEAVFAGRADTQVKIRGFRIELGDVEAALGAFPGVREAVAVAREDGGGERSLAAYVVPAAGAILDERELRAFLRRRLPDFMVPATFTLLDRLPLTPNRKVDRKALPAPEQRRSDHWTAPRTPVEEALAGIWAELLGRERVGADEDFFALGGHSLLATRLVSRLRGAFDIEMPLRALFEAPVLADLAARVEAARHEGASRHAPPLVSVPRRGPLPLSFAQQRLWFIDQLEPGSPLYNVPMALRVEGALATEVLARCLGEIVRRHEALRTVFGTRDGSPVQVIQPAAPFTLAVVDLSALSAARREAAALALAREEADRPFDLARGPLLRALLLRLDSQDHLAAVTQHHIVSDGWSLGILVDEVAALYAAFAAGRPSPLTELRVQYADFAVWQSSWLRGETLEREISYWRRQLADLPPRLELPTDRPRPAAQSFRGTTRPARLPAGLTGKARDLGRREGATLFMVLLAGFQTLLARVSGQQDFAVGTPVAGRNRTEIEGLIGFFVNALVLRAGLRGEPTFRELLDRVRETTLAAQSHQDVPFERLIQELAPERNLAQTPLFQVVLALQNAAAESRRIEGLRVRQMSTTGTTAKFDLTLNLVEHAGGLGGTVEHSIDLFDATTIERLLRQYERLLAAAVETPDLQVRDLPLLPDAERHQVLVEWNDTRVGRGESTLIHELFEAWAA
ncbi:MAG TPA: amino acid adenylation domain-containing protein, partial [Thermoanaerobaculia bacterium]|nr:amino acid adenylation domain-containing protein [Thermoanaerobaculia bacterium]